MKRTNFGVVVFGLVTAVVFGSQSAEPSAQAADGEGPVVLAPPAPVRTLAVGADEVHANIGTKASATPPSYETSGSCGKGMVEVEGDYCPFIEQKCLRWLDPETKMRCAEFAPTEKCVGKTLHKKFCVDRFEWPNTPGEKPLIMKTWYEAASSCKSVGKRLCGETEWTLACEGQERLPYPYGFARNSEACNIDKPHPDVNEAAIANPATRTAEIERLWQGEPSGTREACVSPYGVHDMTGNVDEWVVNESGKPYKSGLKGGYWGPVRDRCRPMTIAHNEEFSFYQIGFRCCSDAPVGEAVAKPDSITTPAARPALALPVGGSQVSALTGS